MREAPERLCLPLIQHFEGKGGSFEAQATKDPAGNWEIGWGHKLSGPQPQPPADWIGVTIDAVKANALAVEDLDIAATGLHTILGDDLCASLTEGQFAALCCFVFNIGAHNFDGSTMCRLLRAGNNVMALKEFDKWVYGHDPVTRMPVVEPGLIRRRNAEKALFLS